MRDLGPRLLPLARGICRSREAAEDVVQEAFIKLWNSPPDGPEKVVPSWMRRVVVNLSINYLRRHKASGPLPEFSTDPAMSHDERPETKLELRESVRRVDEAMSRLPADKRAILIMRVHEELSYQEIADALNIPVGTVMSRLNRARKALMELVQEAEGRNATGEHGDTFPFPSRRAANG